LLLVAACGATAGTSSNHPLPSPPTTALASWNDFPADHHPRPILLLGDYQPGQGFDSNDAKIAGFICHKFSLAAPLPTAIPDRAAATWPDGTKVTYAATAASTAFSGLTQSGTFEPDCSSVAALPVTAIRFGVAGFETDRGQAQMSAWLFRASGAWAEFAEPALVTSAFWKGGYVMGAVGGGATVSSDGLHLTFGFVGGAPSGPCGSDYTAAAAESAHAVAIAVKAYPLQSGGSVVCDLIGHSRSVEVTLSAPLGGRVLLDETGTPLVACPEAFKASC
jgi:hypothetical protein